MEFNLITGLTHEAVLAEILKRIRARTDGGLFGARRVLIVPDRFSFIAEELLLESEGGGLMDCEVQTFNRLYNRHCQKQPFLDRVSACMFIERVLLERRKEFKTLRPSPELAALLYDTLMQFKACGIYPQHLEDLDGELKFKYNDLSKVYGEYQSYLFNSGMSDSTDKLIALSKEREAFKGMHLYFALFDSLTSQHFAVLSNMTKTALSVSLGALSGSNEALFFDGVKNDALAMCAAEGITANVSEAEEDDFSKALLNNAYKSMARCEAGDKKIVALEFGTPEAEAKHAALTVLRGVSKGMRYRDIAILRGNLSADILSETLSAYGIPHFIDNPPLLSQHPLFTLITSALTANVERYAYAACENLLGNPRLNISREKRAAFINYRKRYALNRQAFTKPFVRKDEYYESAEEVRGLLQGVVSRLNGTAIIDVLAACKKLAEDFCTQEDERGLREIQSLIEKAECIFSGEQLKKADLCEALTAGAKSVKLTGLPMYNDVVYIGNAENFRGKRHNALLICGASLGALPVEQTDAGLVTDRDIMRFRAFKKKLEPLISEVNYRNRYELVHSLTTADSVMITYTGEPTALLSYLTGIFGARVIRGEAVLRSLQQNTERFLTYAYPTVAALREAVAGAVESGEVDDCARAAFAALNDRDLVTLPIQEKIDGEGLFFKAGRQISVSRLEKYFACPYQHFLRYGAEVRENEEGGLSARDIGTLIHAVAERFLADNMPAADRKYVLDIIKDDLSRLGDTASDSAVLERVVEESVALCDTLKYQSGITSYKFIEAEREFSNIDIGAAKLVGKIDRIDRCGDYVRIIDYKTGTASLRLGDVYYGRRLQLILYLKALIDEGFLPGGAFYYPIRRKFEDDSPRLVGFALSDIDRLLEHDHTLGDFEKGELLGVRFKADKKTGEVSLHKAYGKGSLYTEDELKTIIKHAALTASRAVEEIASGATMASPAAGACDRCDARSACFYAGGQRRQKDEVDISSFNGGDDE